MMYGWIIVVLIIAIIIWLFITKGKTNITKANKGSASEILDKRFAKGEISKEEFEDKKDELNQKK